MRSRALPPLLVFSLTLAVMCALSWPMPAHLSTDHLFTQFGDSHVWVFDRLWAHLSRGELPLSSAEAGYPQVRAMRAIAWVPALESWVLRGLLGPLGAANAVQLLSLPLSALAAYALLRRWTEAGPWTCAAAAVAYGLCPTMLSTYGMGEVSNTAAWILPGFLWILDRSFDSRRWWPVLALFSLASVFSSPYFGLALPLLLGGWCVVELIAPRVRGERLKGTLRRLVPLVAVVGLGMAPSQLYYGVHQDEARNALFRPARYSRPAEHLPSPSPVAQLDSLFWREAVAPRDRTSASHVPYLGLVLLLGAAAVGLPRGARRRGMVAGWLLVAGGVILALGPRLTYGSDYVFANGRPVFLPVAVLEWAGYPTRDGGLYFRYATLAELGLVLVLAAGLGSRRGGAAAAWLLVSLHVADSVRATGPLWPRPSERVQGLETLKAMRGEDGAVLDLPLQGMPDAVLGQGALLRAVFHGRPTTGLPRDVLPTETPVPGIVYSALMTIDPAASLRGAGFRYVVLPAASDFELDEMEQALVNALGVPTYTGELRVWDLGPTVLKLVEGEAGGR